MLRLKNMSILHTSFALFVILSIGFIWYAFRVPYKFIVLVDQRCSESYALNIKNVVNEQLMLGPYQLMNFLQQQFPEFSSISIRRTAASCCIVSLVLSDPLICLNQNKVLLSQGAIIHSSYINNAILAELASLDIPQECDARLASELVPWVCQIDRTIFDQYRVTWVNRSCIIVEDKTYKDRQCYICTDTPFSFAKLALTWQLVNEKLQEFKNKKIKEGVVADLRFNDQIIISRKKGDHERNII